MGTKEKLIKEKKNWKVLEESLISVCASHALLSLEVAARASGWVLEIA
jgi:hypothetical protein